ncbi:hypothetical protein F5879DRAFT_376004 [Lentinula edodes]|nr:hypothetical protein F5879DRAFT_376004 [Lentinula edodes]
MLHGFDRDKLATSEHLAQRTLRLINTTVPQVLPQYICITPLWVQTRPHQIETPPTANHRQIQYRGTDNGSKSSLPSLPVPSPHPFLPFPPHSHTLPFPSQTLLKPLKNPITILLLYSHSEFTSAALPNPKYGLNKPHTHPPKPCVLSARRYEQAGKVIMGSRSHCGMVGGGITRIGSAGTVSAGVSVISNLGFNFDSEGGGTGWRWKRWGRGNRSYQSMECWEMIGDIYIRS